MAIPTDRRFKRGNECPICDGHGAMKSGKGTRCWGFISENGRYVYCTREEFAGSAPYNQKASAYVHFLGGPCRCGFTHEAGPIAVDGGFYRTVQMIERDLRALEGRAESAQSSAQYEADRSEYDQLWRELEVAKAGVDAEGKPVFPWVGLADMSKPLPPVEWVCEGLKLAKGPISCLAGYGYSGKTAIAQNLLLCLATGKPLFGLFRVAQMPVGWMDYEQGWRMSAGRLQRQARGLGIDLSQYPSNALRYAEFPDVYLDDKGSGVDKIAKAVDGMGLCLMDSAKALTPGIDENDSKIRIPFDALSRVTMKTGCIFLVIHHYGKSGGDSGVVKPLKERMRGSSALFDAMQTVWGLEAKDKDTFTRVSLSKDRVTSLKDLEFGIQFVDDAEHDAVTLRHLDPEQMKSPTKAAMYKTQVLETIKANPKLTSVEAIRFHNPEGFRNLNETRSAVRELEESGLLSSVNGVYRAV